MSTLKTMEFWLFALAGLIVVATVLAVAEKSSFAGASIPWLAIAWMFLAIAWMFKMLLRRVRGS